MQANVLSDTLARLDALTNWERRPREDMKVGLEPIQDLMQRLGNPHKTFRVVHVGGTKGKGSVSSLVESGLRRAGLKVGRYSSPHVEHVTERISILQEPTSESSLAYAISRTMDAVEAARLENTAAADATWFDVFTASAFVRFRDAGLDWVVVEVGLGGRLDSTNVVHGEVAVTTNIELEHTEVLGTSREAIAIEKIGILKKNATLVTTLAAEDSAGRILKDRADALGCCVLRTQQPSHAPIEQRNVEIAGLILDSLGDKGVLTTHADFNETPVGKWLLDRSTRESARLPGRMERFRLNGSSVVLDGAHVPFNLQAVLHDLTGQAGLDGACVAVVALGSDKDAVGFLNVLSQGVAKAVFTELPAPGRSCSPVELKSFADQILLSGEIVADSIQAFRRGVQLAEEMGGWVLVTGSLRLVGIIRGLIAPKY
ncbi:bifunctional folylpolyglutamate synthase/dihydrofolate synthase [Caballeronia mineralivorans]|uniref:bifunctional folylpolyglutamate synthase/dihydrofolate synthase n=1 Tax=Caballeronia mineralivorans TaxID=2010198 RepID=UPI002AFE743B|nr:Mur ligase family protein [Caballeronia mineralivorans]MEA3098518.1 dihydrofolate synthase / folylpolyglutamate synthase [Caballeronia mineralivorans]